jgi:mannose-6-phosphate isomerase-like protein (cupin superfamily)
MRIRTIAVSLAILVSASVWAQQRTGQPQTPTSTPLQGGQVTAAELAAIVARQPKDRNGNQTFLQLAPYNVSMEHRVNVPQSAAVHDKEAELFYVIEGSGTMVTGGRLVNPTRNGDNSTANSVEGGTTKKIAKGDFILVPEKTPHWFSAIDGELTLMSLHLPRS